MTNKIIYAVKTYAVSAEDLTIKEVKLGRTSNIKSTMVQYNRSHRDPEILDLWKANENLKVSKCEKGVLKLAEKYAHERRGETFRFLQDGYVKFSNNVDLLLLPVSIEELTKDDKEKESDKKEPETKNNKYKENYLCKKPEYFVLNKKEIKVNSWRNLLSKVAKIIEKENNSFEKALKIKGRTRNYFSKSPNNLHTPREIPNTNYFFEGNLNAEQIVNIIKKFLEKYGYNFKEDFELELR